MGPSIVFGKERAHGVEQVRVTARAELHQGDSGRRVRDEDVQQSVPGAGTAEECVALPGDVVHGLPTTGGHSDLFGSHVPMSTRMSRSPPPLRKLDAGR